MRSPSSVSAVAVVVSMCGLLGACGSSSSSGKDDSVAAQALVAKFSCPTAASAAGALASGPLGGGKLQVVTTVAPITSIVANIAGDKAVVHGIIPEGEDSHTYEPKPSVAALVSKADIVFVNGLKLEDPTKEIATKNIAKGGEVVELGTLTLSPDEYIYDFSFPKDGGKPNPHLWTNPPMAKCYAAIASSAMSKADPTNASYYTDNYAKYSAKVDQLDRLMIEATAAMPAQTRELLTYHDAYAYFAAHYGWKIIGAIQVSSFEDPTPKEVANLVKQIKAEKVPAIFGSEVFPSPVLAQLAQETGVKYVDKLRDDDLPDAPGKPDHSYLGLMKFDFATMVENLGGDATKLKAFDATDVVTDTANYPQ
jgi:ABC-type Zn uptake system ZnuABC Zn-binding protein ZnuA